jgi:hypothetical protein
VFGTWQESIGVTDPRKVLPPKLLPHKFLPPKGLPHKFLPPKGLPHKFLPPKLLSPKSLLQLSSASCFCKMLPQMASAQVASTSRNQCFSGSFSLYARAS